MRLSKILKIGVVLAIVGLAFSIPTRSEAALSKDKIAKIKKEQNSKWGKGVTLEFVYNDNIARFLSTSGMAELDKWLDYYRHTETKAHELRFNSDVTYPFSENEDFSIGIGDVISNGYNVTYMFKDGMIYLAQIDDNNKVLNKYKSKFTPLETIIKRFNDLKKAGLVKTRYRLLEDRLDLEHLILGKEAVDYLGVTIEDKISEPNRWKEKSDWVIIEEIFNIGSERLEYGVSLWTNDATGLEASYNYTDEYAVLTDNLMSKAKNIFKSSSFNDKEMVLIKQLEKDIQEELGDTENYASLNLLKENISISESCCLERENFKSDFKEITRLLKKKSIKFNKKEYDKQWDIYRDELVDVISNGKINYEKFKKTKSVIKW